MKITIQPKGSRRATVLLVVLALIAIMCLLIIINSRTLYTLNKEIRLVEKRQIQHWTNLPPIHVRPTTR